MTGFPWLAPILCLTLSLPALAEETHGAAAHAEAHVPEAHAQEPHAQEKPARDGHGVEAAASPHSPIDIRPPAEKPVVAGRQPFEMVRSLDALQDQVVQGSVAAQNALPRIIGQMGEKLAAADPSLWKQPKNARAAITYGLSGGQARVLRKILDSGNVPDSEKKLLEGALAYVEGHEAKARQLLLDVDAKALAPTIAGHVALVQAMLAHDDLKKGNDYLDQARLLSPGTLVEETALRREIFNLSDGSEPTKFVLLSSQYLRRFQNSLYADNFKQRFSAAVTQLGVISRPDQFSKIAMAIEDLDSNDQLQLYMLVAQAAILNGNAPIAKLAAEKAMTVAKSSSPDGTRAKLYEAAALVLTNNYEQGLAKLKEVDVSQLSKHDVELKVAILSIAKQIRQWPELKSALEDGEPAANPAAPGRDATRTASAAPVIDLAEKAINDADQLLQEHAR